MKKVFLMIVSSFLFFGTGFAVQNTNATWTADKTTESVILDSTTINFSVTTMEFWVEGDYAVVRSSIATSAERKIYVTPDKPFKYETNNTVEPLIFPGTSQSLTFDLQSGTTFYYFIGGKNKK